MADRLAPLTSHNDDGLLRIPFGGTKGTENIGTVMLREMEVEKNEIEPRFGSVVIQIQDKRNSLVSLPLTM